MLYYVYTINLLISILIEVTVENEGLDLSILVVVDAECDGIIILGVLEKLSLTYQSE